MSETKIATYARRGQSNPQKIYQDALNGKVCEYATYQHFQSAGCPAPDPFIEKAYRWKEDFRLPDGKVLHVKGQAVQSRKRYGAAFMLGTDDKHLTKDFTSQDFLILCYRREELIVDLEAIIPVPLIHDAGLLTKEKVLPHLQHSKWRLPLDDVLSLGKRFWN